MVDDFSPSVLAAATSPDSGVAAGVAADVAVGFAVEADGRLDGAGAVVFGEAAFFASSAARARRASRTLGRGGSVGSGLVCAKASEAANGARRASTAFMTKT